MVTYALPADARGLIFDMDLTLYRNQDYYASQIGNQEVLLASELGCPLEELRLRLAQWQADFREQNQGANPSFGNTLLGALGYPIEKSVRLRRQAIRPEDYLVHDERLATTLDDLQGSFALILVTNNPSDIAERTLGVLGVSKFFSSIIGLDESGHSKPHPAAFDLAYRALKIPADQVVSIGDRFSVDLELPLSRGSGGILVETMDDVYALPGVLRGLAKS